MLHKAERRTATTKTVRETEAEAIAFVVGTSIGLDTGHASADYIQLYHGNAALLAESLELIQRTSALILAAIEATGTTAERTEEKDSGATTDQDAPDDAAAEFFGLEDQRKQLERPGVGNPGFGELPDTFEQQRTRSA